ncbi:MAG: collagenase-like protease, partial [Bacteroidales bacterium]|nr:collagenase-like protease [Bacteroidales bacterium]
MTATPQTIELLAPARDLATAMAAIEHGADAVYMGATRFGARQSAGNSVDDIRRAVEYAHQYGAKVYATVNTIVYDDELDDVRRLIGELYHAGVDALIVQDMGILR